MSTTATALQIDAIPLTDRADMVAPEWSPPTMDSVHRARVWPECYNLVSTCSLCGGAAQAPFANLLVAIEVRVRRIDECAPCWSTTEENPHGR